MVKTEPFDAARYLTSAESQAALLNDAQREALYKALSADGDPRLTTVLGLHARSGSR
jgi:DNA-binding phage protein